MHELEITIKDEFLSTLSCRYGRVKSYVQNESPSSEWMFETEFGIFSDNVDSWGLIQFWNDSECIIKEYSNDNADALIPTDLVYFKTWLEERGWNKFSVDDVLLNENRHLWELFFSSVFDDEDDDDDIDEVYLKDHFDKIKEKLLPQANKFIIRQDPDFINHQYDFDKRTDDESRRIF